MPLAWSERKPAVWGGGSTHPPAIHTLLLSATCAGLPGNGVFFYKKKRIHFWLRGLFSSCRGRSVAVVCRRLCEEPSHVADHKLQSMWARGCCLHGLSCSVPCGIFLGQGSDPRLWHRQADSSPSELPGRPTLGLSASSSPQDHLEVGLLTDHLFQGSPLPVASLLWVSLQTSGGESGVR